MNHIFLIMQYYSDLQDLKMIQLWIDTARGTDISEEVQEALYEREAEIYQQRNHIYDKMFEIPRNN